MMRHLHSVILLMHRISSYSSGIAVAACCASALPLLLIACSEDPAGPMHATGRGTALRTGSVSGFATISAGFVSSCGLTADGTAYCWGTNDLGLLGDGTTQSH